MPNLARSASPRPAPSTGPGALLDALREARGEGPLPGLDPATYARDHAAFEVRSDQRALIAAHLRARLARRGSGPVSVLAVGCGDGTLDAPLAAALVDADPSRPVRYVGVEPFAGSAAGFGSAMAGLERPGLEVQVHVATFEEYVGSAAATEAGRFDVVTFVHSLYYVPDVEVALGAAHDLLRPGGELLVLHAPRGALNALVDVLAPPLQGHRQWFSDDVATAVARAGLVAEEVLELQARVDLLDAADEVLDFAVQARLTPALRRLVREYLRSVAVPGAAGPDGQDGTDLVPHPVDAFRLVRPRSSAYAG